METAMTAQERYISLTGRISSLKLERAVLLSKETERADELKIIRKELDEQGLDPDDPQSMIEVKKRIEDLLSSLEEQVAELENSFRQQAPQVTSNVESEDDDVQFT